MRNAKFPQYLEIALYFQVYNPNNTGNTPDLEHRKRAELNKKYADEIKQLYSGFADCLENNWSYSALMTFWRRVDEIRIKILKEQLRFAKSDALYSANRSMWHFVDLTEKWEQELYLDRYVKHFIDEVNRMIEKQQRSRQTWDAASIRARFPMVIQTKSK
jgi:tRNA A37 N6-isopentenylltransferase MiaA